MNLTRYLTIKDVPRPNQYINEFGLRTSGNEFSDEKSATILINNVIGQRGLMLNMILISIWPIGGGNLPLCIYVATV